MPKTRGGCEHEGAPQDTSRVADTRAPNDAQRADRSSRASTEAQPVERSEVRRAKPICRPKSLASRGLRRTERSQSRGDEAGRAAGRSRAQEGSGAESGGRAEGSQWRRRSRGDWVVLNDGSLTRAWERAASGPNPPGFLATISSVCGRVSTRPCPALRGPFREPEGCSGTPKLAAGSPMMGKLGQL